MSLWHPKIRPTWGDIPPTQSFKRTNWANGRRLWPDGGEEPVAVEDRPSQGIMKLPWNFRLSILDFRLEDRRSIKSFNPQFAIPNPQCDWVSEMAPGRLRKNCQLAQGSREQFAHR